MSRQLGFCDRWVDSEVDPGCYAQRGENSNLELGELMMVKSATGAGWVRCKVADCILSENKAKPSDYAE